MERMLRKRWRRLLERTGAKAILVKAHGFNHPDANFLYLTDICLNDATFIFTESGPSLLVAEMMEEQAEEVGVKYGCEVYTHRNNYFKKLRKIIGRVKVAVPFSSTSYAFLMKMRKVARLVDASEHLSMMRMVKDPYEIKRIRKACLIGRRCGRKVLSMLREGMTEKRLYDLLRSETCLAGSRSPFNPIVVSGRRSRFPHAAPSSRKFRRGDVLLMDWGAVWKGYCSDMTRCSIMENPEVEKAYAKLKHIFFEIRDFLEPGISGRELSLFAERLMKREGFPRMPHNIGHGIGLEVHEYPKLGRRSKHILKENVVVAIEPAIYLPNFGLRYENLLLIGKKATLL